VSVSPDDREIPSEGASMLGRKALDVTGGERMVRVAVASGEDEEVATR
jgi:hypothetical protein